MQSTNYSKITIFLKKRVIEIIGLLIILLSFFLLLSISTHTPEDPNFIFSENTEVKNLFGFYGSFISDIILQAFGIVSFLLCINLPLLAEIDIDQWEDSKKTYYDLIEEGFQVKAYEISNMEIDNGYLLMFFVTVLQKKNVVYECQEYQTLDMNMQTLDMNLVCRKLVQPYTRGLGT